ncbi:hypothetical protein K435DRAFT_864738 [Dendrothele bispora CBS 962.96]|uniref:Uncharacterized protein n=1 Tax=Dendrothele bispora (strain CBS 962.96) TaxID=1314807 RepID=A0A4S8LLB6_DENBC|nr:hypothetical protein K435DRAFT_864738 [Dendrothele bispora CBS 962.96]
MENKDTMENKEVAMCHGNKVLIEKYEGMIGEGDGNSKTNEQSLAATAAATSTGSKTQSHRVWDCCLKSQTDFVSAVEAADIESEQQLLQQLLQGPKKAVPSHTDFGSAAGAAAIECQCWLL